MTVQEPLIHAAYDGDVNKVKHYLSLGADPLIPDEGGKTVLTIAVENKRPDMVRVLLAHGANPNDRLWESTEKDPFKKTPIIDLAKKDGDRETVRLLRQAGATE